MASTKNRDDSNRVFVFDTTLRDGEQAAGKLMPNEKLRIARMLENAGVDIIEAGFPISSQGEFEAISKIATDVKESTVCVLARAKRGDIESASKVLKMAKHPRIHTFLATSDVHMEHKLRMSRAVVLENINNMTLFARTFVDDVQFSMEDAGRSDVVFLAQAIQVAIKAGARTINIPDTVGYCTPWSLAEMIRELYRLAPELHNVVLSVHCHNDLGLALANTLSGVREGARQVEGCILGVGERAGNTATEEVVMSLSRHPEQFGNVWTQFEARHIGDIARTVSESFGCAVWQHKPLVGSKVFAHSSGIHADGMSKNSDTYEVIKPADVGWAEKPTILQSHMGRKGLSLHLDKMGYDGGKIVEAIYPKFTSLADAKSRITDEDLRMLVHEYMAQNEVSRDRLFRIDSIFYKQGSSTVSLSRGCKSHTSEAYGNGAIDAMWVATLSAARTIDPKFTNVSLADFQVVKGEGGSESNAWVVVRVRCGDKEAQGYSGDPDTIIAAGKAFVYAINHLSF